MTIDQLRDAHRAHPFKPFKICLTDGRQIPVPHPEFLFILPGRSRTVVVATSSGTAKMIDALLVTSLDFEDGDLPGGED